jgi:hypothetical protein
VWLTKQAYNPTWQYLDFLGDGTNDCLKARNDADGQGAQADFVFESCSFNKFNRALVAGTLAADGVNTPVYNWKVQNSWMNGCVEYARIDAPAADGMEFYNVSMTDQLGVSDYMFYTSASASGELILINVKGSFYNTYAHVGTAFIKMAAGFGLTAINTRCEGSPTGWKWLDTANSPGNKPVTLINCQGIVIPDSGDYITCGITEGLNIIGGKFKGQINTTGNCIPSVVGADIASAIFIGNSTSAAYVNVPASYGIAQQPGISYGGYPIGQYAFESRSRGAMIGGDIISAKPTVLGSETLTNPNLTGGASWTATNDCTLAADAATWAYSAGTASTLTQASGALAVAAQGNRQYLFTYVVSNVIPSTSGSIRPTASITTAFGAFTVPLQIVAGSQSLIFKCAASPGDFVITSTLLAGQAFTLDTFSLKEITGGNVVAAGKFTGGGGYGLKIDKDGNAVFDGKIKATLSVYANNAAAIAGGLVAGQLYRTGADPDQVCIVH